MKIFATVVFMISTLALAKFAYDKKQVRQAELAKIIKSYKENIKVVEAAKINLEKIQADLNKITTEHETNMRNFQAEKSASCIKLKAAQCSRDNKNTYCTDYNKFVTEFCSEKG